MSESIEQTSIAVIPTNRLPTLLQAPGAMDTLNEINAKIKGCPREASTKENEDKIRSVAADIRKAKASLIRISKAATADDYARYKAGLAECKIVEETFDDQYLQVRAPLTAKENWEKDRRAGHETALSEITSFATIPADWPSGHIATRIDELEQSELWTRDWQEFRDRAMDCAGVTMNTLRTAHVGAVKREDDARELAELRAAQEQAQRLAREREEEAAAELARIRHEEAVRVAAEAARVAAEAAAARRAEEAEVAAQSVLEAAMLLEREARETLRLAEERAETERLATLGREKLAAQKAEADKLAAIEAERARLEREQAAAEVKRVREAEAVAKADAARAANVAHRKKINGEALVDLMARVRHQCGAELSEALARTVIIVIAKGEIRHMKVEY